MRPVPTRPESAWRMVRGRGAGFAALLCALFAASLVAAGDDNYPTGDPVIPPGEEELIGTMLGKGTALDHCALISGGVEYTTIKATYRCLGGEVRLELANLRNARASSTQSMESRSRSCPARPWGSLERAAAVSPLPRCPQSTSCPNPAASLRVRSCSRAGICSS